MVFIFFKVMLVTGTLQVGVRLPDTKARLHQGVWHFRRVVQSTTSILVPHPPPHGKIRSNVITFIYSPHPQHQGVTDTNTKKLMTLAALQKSWMHLCTHSPIEGIDFPTVCVCHWWYSVVDCLQISACIINQPTSTLEAILVTLGVFLHSYCTHPIYSFLID